MTSLVHLPPHRLAGILAMIFSLLGFHTQAQDANAASTASNYKVVVDTGNAFNFAIKDTKDATALSANLIGWAPGFKWVDIFPPTVKGPSGDMTLTSTFTVDNTPDTTINISVETNPIPNGAVYKYTLTSTKDIPITSVVSEIGAPDGQTTGSVTIVAQSSNDYSIPIVSGETVPLVSKAVFHLAGGDVVVDINPPTSIALRATGFRLLLAADVFKAGTMTTTVTYSFPTSPASIAK
jgi:hypothetical protein